MARIKGPKKIHRYSAEFKLKAVKLSQIEGVQVQDVADALDIHPFMSSAGARRHGEGRLKARVAIAPEARAQREVRQSEKPSASTPCSRRSTSCQKKPFGSVPLETKSSRSSMRRRTVSRCRRCVPATCYASVATYAWRRRCLRLHDRHDQLAGRYGLRPSSPPAMGTYGEPAHPLRRCKQVGRSRGLERVAHG